MISALSVVFILGLLVTKYMFRDAYALIDIFGSVVIGLTLATILVHAVFIDSDKFFTKVEKCQFKLFMIMIGQLIIASALLAYKQFIQIEELGDASSDVFRERNGMQNESEDD